MLELIVGDGHVVGHRLGIRTVGWARLSAALNYPGGGAARPRSEHDRVGTLTLDPGIRENVGIEQNTLPVLHFETVLYVVFGAASGLVVPGRVELVEPVAGDGRIGRDHARDAR